ncbi:putative RNA-binding protein 15B [Thelohanellus kitauei]|uniref:Putative RNA-binding protein 15B n=1 Tax=Thelohanellus kitauei TaxID=669202 RepID=A0A0C2IA65_THEKT|nr:putative RNA-binding protein 15B [Thelohanellus kitauei]
MSAIAAKENETNSKIGGSYIKVSLKFIEIGFGRANVYDTIWVGGYEPNNLKTLLEKVQALPGFVWSLTDKVLNQTIIKFYKMGNSSDAQDKIDRFSPPLDNLKFVSRMEKSGQSVNEAILRDYDMQKRSHYIDNSSDDSPKYIQKHKEHHAKTSRVSERLARKHDDSSSEEPAKKRRHPSHSPTHGSDDSKINSLDSHSRSRTRNREKSHEKRPFKIWSGELHLKRKSVHVMFKFFKGNRTVFDACLAKMVKGEEKLRVLQIEQRMVLDKEHYSLINYRLKKADDSAFAIAIVDDKYPDDESSLCKHFMEYFTEKNAAGVINIHDSKHHDLTHVLYAFPDCSFARVHTKDAPSEIRDVMSTQSYLLILALRCH